jgi:hypothetical protein
METPDKVMAKSKMLLCLLLLFFAMMSCKQQAPILIKPLHPFYDLDTVYMENGEICVRLSGNFTINCELKDSTRFMPVVDSFLRSLPDSITKAYCVTTLWFYREGDILNPDYRSKGEEHPFIHNDEVVFEVHWMEGEFRGYSFYKDGLYWSQDNSVELVPVENK